MSGLLVKGSSMLVCLLIVSLGTATGEGELRSKGDQPEQVHIAVGKTPGSMSVSWVTLEKKYDATSTVKYGETQALEHESTGTQHEFEDKGDEKRKYMMHVADMEGLRPNTLYYYKVGSHDLGWSDVFQFKNLEGRDSKDVGVAVFGDLGLANMQAMHCLRREAQDETVNMLLHAGDLAYDLDDDNGKTGDEWMRKMEPITSRVPYMVLHGNHEAGDAFNHFTQRFRNMPSNSGVLRAAEWGSAPNNWFYSFNVGLVHYIMISTEIYFFDPGMIERQHKWLEADLKAANTNRTQAPWIIVLGHRPLYCSGNSNCDDDATLLRDGDRSGPTKDSGMGLEKLFYENGVDLYLCGHTHNYERMFDISPSWDPLMPWASGYSGKRTEDMAATTYVVVGMGGTESMTSFNKPLIGRSAVRDNEHYGYAKFRVLNSTHLVWQQILCDDRFDKSLQGSVLDEVTYIQRRHGSFSQRNTVIGQATEVVEDALDGGLWSLLGVAAVVSGLAGVGVAAWKRRPRGKGYQEFPERSPLTKVGGASINGEGSHGAAGMDSVRQTASGAWRWMERFGKGESKEPRTFFV